MRYALLALLLAACGTQPLVPPETVTITKTVPAYPPDSLYSATGGCQHGPTLSDGTVRDLANALITERSAVDVCLGDRSALRTWDADNKAGNK